MLLHVPASHTRPAPHAMPQPPQLFAFDWVSTHWLLQRVDPPPHWHRPPKQLLPKPQLLPQVPQLLGSNCVKVHKPLHNVCTGKHSLTQLPKLQTWPF